MSPQSATGGRVGRLPGQRAAEQSATLFLARPSRHSTEVAFEVAKFEARRLLRHPILLAGTGLYLLLLVTTGDDGHTAVNFDTIATGPTYFIGVFTYFAANLVASRARRNDCVEHHMSFPSLRTARTAGLCLATLAPALLTVAIGQVALLAHTVAGTIAERPTVAEMAAGPLTVVGAGLLGIMIARWLPYPMTSVVVMVGVIAVTMWLSSRPETLQMLAPYVAFGRWSDSGAWIGRYPGSAEWHAAYLVALCAMAATGALLPDARRKLPVLAVGAAFTAAAVLAGSAQLP